MQRNIAFKKRQAAARRVLLYKRKNIKTAVKGTTFEKIAKMDPLT